MTNLVTNLTWLVSVITTQWLTIPGDRMTLSGTNYLYQIPICATNLVERTAKWTTNETTFHYGPSFTNGPAQWRPEQVPALPSIPSKL